VLPLMIVPDGRVEIEVDVPLVHVGHLVKHGHITAVSSGVQCLRGSRQVAPLGLVSVHPGDLLARLGLLSLRLPLLLPHHQRLESTPDGHADVACARRVVLGALAAGWLNAHDACAARAVPGVLCGCSD